MTCLLKKGFTEEQVEVILAKLVAEAKPLNSDRREVNPSSRSWERLRREMLERAGYRCQRCGKAGRLEVHHRNELATGGAVYDPINLEVLCRDCHIRHHRGELSPELQAWDALVERIR